MSLMSALYVGTSGLQTSQNALNTTAHNLTNVDTKGYVRQQVMQSNKSYVTLSKDISSIANKQTGLGVTYSCVKHVRDYFLDKTYRREAGRGAFYETSTEVLEETENLLGEMDGEDFQTALTDFWTAVQELAKDPSSAVTQGLLVQRAAEFVERATSVYDSLSNYQDNLNAQIKLDVEQINKYGKQILELNDQIRAIEAGGVEHANDLRDTRDQILDSLAEMVNITYTEDAWGSVSVRIEGEDFVKGSLCYEIGLETDENTGFYTPFWKQNAEYTLAENGTKIYDIEGAEVFDLTREISSDLNTDIGSVKAMLLARGDHRADYTDIAYGDYNDVSQSILMNIQAEFDQMIHNVVSKVNSILADAAGVQEITVGGEAVRGWAVESDGYLRGDDGCPLQLFEKITTAGYEKVTADDGKEYWIYNEEDPARQETLYTLKNLRVGTELMQTPSKLGFIRTDKEVDYDVAEALKAAFQEETYTLNPNLRKKTNFVDYYTDLVSQVANSGSVYRSIYTNQEATVEATDAARQQVIGVSSDEELNYMLKFQNAYNASSRYFNVINEMLAHLLNALGT